MSRVPLYVRIGLGVASLSVSALCLLYYVGVMPDATSATLRGRKALCEAIAINCSMAAVRGDFDAIVETTRSIIERNPDVVSAEVRLEDGRLLAPFGPPAPARPASLSYVSVPIYINAKRWGMVRVAFRPLTGFLGLSLPLDPETRFIVTFAAMSLMAHCMYLSFILNRSKRAHGTAIPDRVRATLDTLVEGVLLMDDENRIALANAAFAKKVGRTVEELESQTAEALEWTRPDADDRPSDLPWNSVIRGGSRNLGVPLALRADSTGERFRLSVNSTPILSDTGVRVGVLATFDDLTEVERKNDQLRKLLDKLRDKRVELERVNKNLQELATRDPLTGCLNRRAFFEHFETAWKVAERHDQPLSVVMLDIDHFKSVNDRHGHAVGDEALRVVSGVLKSMVRGEDHLCRYGGEEFCILFGNTTTENAVIAAERFRMAIAAAVFSNISVTSSFGVASRDMGAGSPHDLLNLADKSLYAAKRGGRNQVVRFDRIPEESREPDPKPATGRDPSLPAPPPTAPISATIPDPVDAIPYHAVTSLLAALAHRDADTALHSRRVASLCVATARGLLSGRECYVLEIAALLHDVGKLGIPDKILKKPGPLDDVEWQVMRAHDRMGVEIITAAFSSPELREIVLHHHTWFEGGRGLPGAPSGERIPLPARILAIADAYDAMVSNRVYRAGRSSDAAVSELRRCAGTQFDPALVERFAEVVNLPDRDRDREPGALTLTPLSKHAALKVGLHIEKLATALDRKNLDEVKATVAKVQAAAHEFQIAPLAEMAGRLDQAVLAKADWMDVLEIADHLLDLCRATQASYLATYNDEPPPSGSTLPEGSGQWLATSA